MYRLIAILIVLLSAPTLHGQSQLNMLNGKIHKGNLYGYDSSYVDFSFFRKGKEKRDLVDRYRVFSVIDSNGVESVLYIQDSMMGNPEPASLMKYFVAGEQDAYATFKPHLSNICGFAFGLGISFVDTYQKDGAFFNGFFKGSPGFAHLLSPFVYTIIAGFPGITFDLGKLSNRSYLLEDSYREGFARVVKNKRRFGGLKFSLLGSLTGLGIYGLAQLAH